MIEKQKEFTGILKEYDETTVTIEEDGGNVRTFEKADIALIRLAFDFKRLAKLSRLILDRRMIR